MQMKNVIIAILLVPTLMVRGQKDPAAEKYLDKFAKELDAGHALAVEFNYTREDQQSGSTVEGSGSLVLMGEKYKIDLGDAIIWFDGKTQYSLQTEIEEVYVSTPDPDNKEFMFTDPIRLLRNYREAFKYRVMGESNFDGVKTTEIQLYPEELGGPYALLKLFFQTENSGLRGIVIRHKDGILYTMIVDHMDQKENPGDAYFRFSETDYPNVEIIELLN